MRPIRLEFAGLQSYREPQAIDFDQLLSAGLFGIFGPTGAGKSTILDAITLALYGQVERANRGTSGIMNQAERRLWVKFSFSLQGGGQYRVERSYRREKDGESIRTEHCRLVEVVGGLERVLADKERDLTNQVVAILGLNADDFSRAVVLPQGQFAKFLALGDKDRRQMLQRIFNLGQYGDRLAERLKGRLDAVRTGLTAVQAEQAGLGDGSAAAVADAEARLALAEERLAEALAARDRLDAELQGASQVWALQQELATVGSALADWQRRGAAAEADRAEAEGARRAEVLRPHLDASQQAVVGARQAAARLAAAAQHLEAARTAFETAQAAYDQARARRAADEPALTERRVKLARAAELEAALIGQDATVADLTGRVAKGRSLTQDAAQAVTAAESALAANSQAESARRQALAACAVSPDERSQVATARRALDRLAEAERALTATQQREATRQSALAAARAAAERAQAEQQAQAARLTAAEGALQQLQQECPADEADLRAEESWLVRADEFVRAVAAATAALTAAEGAAERSAAEAARLEGVAATARAAEAAARAALDRAEGERAAAGAHLTATQRLAHAAALVATLHDGQPCPVCGSPHHPAPADGAAHPDEAAARAALAAAEAASQRAQQALLAAATARSAADHQLVAAQQRASEAAAARTDAEGQLTAARARLPGPWQPLAPDQLPAALAAAQAEQGRRRQALQRWQAALEQQRELREEQAGLSAQATAAAASARATLDGAAAAATEAAHEVTRLTGEVGAAQGAFAAAWESPDRATLLAAEQRIAEADQEGAALQQVLDRLRHERTTLEETLTQARATHEKYTQALHQRQLELAQAEQLRAHTDQEWRRLTGGQPAGPQLTAVESALRALAAAESTATASREQALAARQAAETERAAAASEQELTARRQAEAAQALTAALAAAHFADGAAAAAALRTPERLAALERAIAAYDREGHTLQSRQGQLVAALAGRSLAPAEWEQLQANRQAAQAHLDGEREERARAAQALADCLARRQRWEVLEEQRLRLATSQNHLDDLKLLLRGNAFVDYLAQEQMARVAAEASARLGQLSRGRYALELEPGGGFIMRDDANGATRRAVSTLSGGETFITSLALALALSAQIQLRGHYPLEFFFLDEGFGTLDPELLDLVVSTLERLQFEQLHVGVISHVPELRSRLQRRVIVEPAEPGGRGSRLRLERA